jgi:DNA recombination protein RmuC
LEKLKKIEQPQDDQAQSLMLQTIKDLREEISKSSGAQRQEMTNTLDLLEKKFTNLNKSVDDKISENTKMLGERLDNAAKVISQTNAELGKMQEIGENVKSFTDFLRHGKRRGILGEEGLNDMLTDALSVDQFALQYRFSSGDTVDAVVKTANGLIPIDAKFPLENFRAFTNAENDTARDAARKEFGKDVKKHIDAIAKKYIRPDEGTTNFAVMYIPAESVHYEAAIADETLANYARSQHIHLVSPNSLFYFLRVILLAFQSQKIEENAKRVLGMIAGVKKESEKFGAGLELTSKHLGNAKKNMDDTVAGWDRLSGRIERVSELGEGTTALEVEPKQEEKQALL